MRAASLFFAMTMVLGCGSTETAAEGDGVDAARVTDAAPPAPPSTLIRYLVGDASDKIVTTKGPGLILMGGGPDVDAAFTWWKPLLGGGDVVVLRADDRSGYGPYLFTDIGGVDSVETLVVDTRAAAESPYVAWALAHAEGIFLAGGDQSKYLAAWKGTTVETELRKAWSRGAIVGGTSAGCMVLGDLVYSAEGKGAVSADVLDDPFDPTVTLEPSFLDFPPLVGAITDTHFGARDRMGRLVGFVARGLVDGTLPLPALGLGIDEGTALLVDKEGKGTVVGSGAVYAVRATTKPKTCKAGAPLEFSGLALHRLRAGDGIALPSAATSIAPTTLSAGGGTLSPKNPY